MFGSVLFTLVAFIVAISVLVAVHEFGHFWVAKTLGVKVLRYSIGFGRPLWRHRAGADQTEYVVAVLPVGGYVKMLDEREGEVAAHELHRAFNRQPVYKRFAIVLAGPLFNFLLAIVIYWLVFIVGVSGIKPVIGEVRSGSVAAVAGLHAGEEIVAVNGRITPIWDAALQALLPAMIDRSEVALTLRERNGDTRHAQLDFRRLKAHEITKRIFEHLGIVPWLPRVATIIGKILPGSAAQQAGLEPGDHIVAANGKALDDWQALVDVVRKNTGKPIVFRIDREGRSRVVSVTPHRVMENGARVAQVGITPAQRTPMPQSMKAIYRYPVLGAINEAVHKTWTMSTLTLNMLGKILIGEASVKNLSGPINIARYAGESASAGPTHYLDFIAIVSLSLGVLNLLPIPILDGGHLLYYFIEIVKGSPVSEQTEAVGQRVGIVILVMLMSLAFYNDLSGLFG